ncbi:MAG: hypothetical protein M1551_09785, partial [Firmicutes bacterium]|nr:hypothetical protein [Bacillota bacterium]
MDEVKRINGAVKFEEEGRAGLFGFSCASESRLSMYSRTGAGRVALLPLGSIPPFFGGRLRA